jgi:hypothetical protein
MAHMIPLNEKQQAILHNLVNARDNAQAALNLALASMLAGEDVPEGAQVAGLEDGALILEVPGDEDENGHAGPA